MSHTLVPCPKCKNSIQFETAEPGASVACDRCGQQVHQNPHRGRYDPAFREAVEGGYLTPGQAYARGKREAYAERVAARHGLSLSVAYEVADNRTSLIDNLHEQEAQQMAEFAAASSSGLRLKLAAVAIFAVAFAVAGWQPWNSRQAQSDTRARVMARESGLIIDDQGRVVRVVAEDPESVLATFCEGAPDKDIQALGVMPSSAESPTTRIGVIRDGNHPDQPLAIAIRRDRSSGQWYSGDGLRPLTPRGAPRGALNAVRKR